MKKLLLLIMILFLSISSANAIDEIKNYPPYNSEKINTYGIKQGDKLYLQDCVKLAIQNSPIIKKEEQILKIIQNDVNLAKSNYFPTIGLKTNFFQEFNSNTEYDSGTAHTYLPTVGVYLNQLIWDFGKTNSLINMQKFNKLAAEYNYIDSICTTINNIKIKYYAVLKSKEIVEAEKDNYEINKKILDNSEKKAKIDYINAQVYFSKAKMNLEKAENDYKQAMADLCNEMYIAGAPEFEIVKIDVYDAYDAFFTPGFLTTPKGQWHKITNRPYETGLGKVQTLHFSMQEAIETAYNNSPDIKAIFATIKAMNESVKATKRQYMPVLSTNLGYNFNNRYRQDKEDYWHHNNNYGISVNLSTQLNGMKIKNEIAKSKANVIKAEQNLKLFQEDLYFAVKKCYLNVKTAETQILNAQEQTEKSLETLYLTGKNYEKNKATYLELQLARQNYNNARIAYANVIYDYNSSLAKLQKAMHYNIKEIVFFAEHANPSIDTKIDLSILNSN